MGKVINLEEKRQQYAEERPPGGWEVGPTRCIGCGHKDVTVIPVQRNPGGFECGRCHRMLMQFTDE